MIFKIKHSNKQDPHYKIVIDDKHIEESRRTKFLGILIDNNLVSKYNGIIRKVRPFLNEDSLHTLYNTLVLPIYHIVQLYGETKITLNLDSLFITQKKIIRTCTNSIWLEHTTPLFLSLKKLKIRDIYTHQIAVHMYRYHHDHDLLPPGLPNNNFTVQSDIHNHNTRQALDLHIDPTNTKLAENTIKTQGPMIWNSINKTIKICRSLASFKKSLKKHILAHCSSNVTTNKYAPLT